MNFLVAMGVVDNIIIYINIILVIFICFCFACLVEMSNKKGDDIGGVVGLLVIACGIFSVAFQVYLRGAEPEFIIETEKNTKKLESMSEVKNIGKDDSSGKYLVNLCLNGVGFEGFVNKEITRNNNFYCGDQFSRVVLKNITFEKAEPVKSTTDDTVKVLVMLKLYAIADSVIKDYKNFEKTDKQINDVIPHLKPIYEKILVESLRQKTDKLNFVKTEDRLEFKKITELVVNNCYGTSGSTCDNLREIIKTRFEKFKKIELELKSLDSDVYSLVSKI